MFADVQDGPNTTASSSFDIWHVRKIENVVFNNDAADSILNGSSGYLELTHLLSHSEG